MCSPGRLLLKVILCGASELSIPSGTTKRLLALLGFELGPLAFVEPLSSFKPGKQRTQGECGMDCRWQRWPWSEKWDWRASQEVSSNEWG